MLPSLGIANISSFSSYSTGFGSSGHKAQSPGCARPSYTGKGGGQLAHAVRRRAGKGIPGRRRNPAFRTIQPVSRGWRGRTGFRSSCASRLQRGTEQKAGESGLSGEESIQASTTSSSGCSVRLRHLWPFFRTGSSVFFGPIRPRWRADCQGCLCRFVCARSNVHPPSKRVAPGPSGIETVVTQRDAERAKVVLAARI